MLADLISAHGYAGGSGWIHPLTGIDHTVAMLAVGAWSSLLGGRALWLVPTAFVAAMAAGGAVGLTGAGFAGTEVAIAASVALLGLAIAGQVRVTAGGAGAAVVVFGVCHGIVHGTELAHGGHTPQLLGVLVTTGCLHAAGAAGALLLVDRGAGLVILRVMGTFATVLGVVLLTRL